MLILPMLFGAFRPPKPESWIWSCANIFVAFKVEQDASKFLVLGSRERPWRARPSAGPVVEKLRTAWVK